MSGRPLSAWRDGTGPLLGTVGLAVAVAVLIGCPRGLAGQPTSTTARCTPTGVLVGMVSRLPQGQAVSGAIVRLGPASAIAGAIAGAIASASSDQQGHVRFDRVPSGSVEIEVVAAGLARRMILATVCGPDTTRVFIRLAARAAELERVVVTAQETPISVEGSSVSRIGRDAIEHLQASSLADVLQLVPGQPALNPTLSGVRQSLLRQAPTASSRDPGPGTDAERANALGTSLVLDGVPVSNNANLQTTLTILNSGPSALPQFASSAGRGLDLRQFAADNVESVEVIRGIPSARHGDLTAGAILVTSRAGAQRPELRVRANPLTLEASTVAGWGSGARGLSLDANLVQSQDDPRSTQDRFTRASAQLAWSARPGARMRTTVRVRGYRVIDETQQDPDDRRYQRRTEARDRGGRADLRIVHGDPALRAWQTELTASASYAEQVGRYQELITRDIFPVTGALRDTLAPGVYGRSEYLTQLTVDGRPLNVYARLETRTDVQRGTVRHQPVVGLELRYDDNRGAGRLFDPIQPPRQNYAVGDRPNSFATIAALTQLAGYGEYRVRALVWRRALDVRLGARLDAVDPSWRGGGTHGAVLVPRLSATMPLTRHLTLRGGHGVLTKAPTLSQLYPLPRYFDLISFNYYPTTPAERLVLFTTRVVDPRSDALSSARAAKSEMGIDWTMRGASGTVSAFAERTVGAFGTTRVPLGIAVPQYRATAFPAGRPPVLDPTPFRVDRFVALYDTPRNTRAFRTRGVEVTAEMPEWRPVRTQASFSGAWFNTVATDTDVDIPVEQFLSGSVQPERVGVYEGGRGSEASRVLTSLRLVHRMPALGLAASVLWQTIWFDDDRPVGRLDGVPVGVIGRDGVVRPLTREEALTPAYAALVRPVSPLESRWERRPALHLVNMRLTKTLPWRTQLALFANNALADRPLYQRQRQLGFERRNEPLFFGMELVAAMPFVSSH